MHKRKLITGVIVCLLGSFLAMASSLAKADNTPVLPYSGDWEWYSEYVTGKEIPMEQVPSEGLPWMQLLSDGLSLSGSAEICHPFREGQFGWTVVIHNYSAGSWHELATETKWVPDTSGRLMACAYAPSKGTYALFGYYIPPLEERTCREFSLTSLNVTMVGDNGFMYYGTISPAIENIKVAYKITSINPAGSITGATSAETLTDADGNFSFSAPFFIDFETVMSFRQVFLIDGCKADLDIS